MPVLKLIKATLSGGSSLRVTLPKSWCKLHKIDLMFIQPGKPMQNGFIERCNGNIRRELLNAYVFKTLNEVREKTEEWMHDYNNNRPHAALNYKTPMEILENV